MSKIVHIVSEFGHINEENEFYIQKTGEIWYLLDIILIKRHFISKKMHIISWFGHKARKREENVQNFILKSKGDHDTHANHNLPHYYLKPLFSDNPFL